MQKLKNLFFGITVVLFTSCGNVGGSSATLPNNLIEDNVGYEKLLDYVYTDYPDLKDNIEVLEFYYSGSIHPQNDQLSSYMDISFVKGTDKNRIVEYSINNEGALSSNDVDISIGGALNKKLSNTYETYQPFLFSAKGIDLEVLRKIIPQSIEEFKKETNVEKAYCSSISIEKKGKKPIIAVTISRRKFAATIRRSSKWTIDGKKI